MSGIWAGICDSVFLQFSIGFLVLSTGLFIVAAVQRRLVLLTAFTLSGMLLVSFCMTFITGWVTLSRHTADTRITHAQLEATAALQAGDARQAFTIIGGALRQQSGRPADYLTGARAALLLGDVAAADHYYDLLLRLDDREMERYDLTAAKQELSQWQSCSASGIEEQRGMAKTLIPQVETRLSAVRALDPAQGEAAANHERLQSLEMEIARINADGQTASSAQIDSELTQLIGQPGAQGARELLIDARLAQGQELRLIDWLYDDGLEGRLDLAGLLLDGRISADALSVALPGGQDARTVLMEELAQDLYAARSRAGELSARLYWTLAQLYTANGQDTTAREMLNEALDSAENPATDPETAQGLNRLAMMLETFDDAQDQAALAQILSGTQARPGKPDAYPTPSVTPGEQARPGKPDAYPTPSAAVTDSGGEDMGGLPPGLSGGTIREDLGAFFNICAPEMTEPGRLRFYVTLAGGSGGFPGGEPQAEDFAFRSNVGFQRQLSVRAMQAADTVQRYTLLLIDCRPQMSAQDRSLAKAAALSYVQTMQEDENVLVYKGGIPSSYRNAAYPAGTTQLFGNMEMETFLLSSDKAELARFIESDYGGDAYDNPDIYHMLSWALNQMTAIRETVSGAWEGFPLSAATPRFGQVLVFTNGDSGAGVAAGGDKSPDYVRGAAIAANAAVHIVRVGRSNNAVDIDALAAAGRGSCIDPATDSLTAFYEYVRQRQVRVFLADCSFPEDPADAFFDLWAQHTPTGAMAGFRRNPGRGADLIGTLHYSDASLSSTDFHDYTGDGSDLTTGGGDSFGTGQDGQQQDGTQGNTQQEGQSGGGVTDWPGQDTLRVDGLDRHAVARGFSGMVLLSLLGQGFDGLTSQNIVLTFPGLGTVQSAFISVADDTAIRFFLPVTMPAGLYSLEARIGGQTFSFPDTLWVYDASSYTVIRFGEWTISAASVQQDAASGGWALTGAVVNDYVRFSGQTILTGNWLDPSVDEISLSPGGEAALLFNPDSDDVFIRTLFLEQDADLIMGDWGTLTLARAGGGAAFSVAGTRPFSLGIFDIPIGTGTFWPDHVEAPVSQVDLDLPLQKYLFMYEGLIPCAASGATSITIGADVLHLALEAGLKSGKSLQFMSALKIKEFSFEIDTATPRVAVDADVELAGGKGFSGHVAFKGLMLDEISLTAEVEIPVTTTPPSPIPVSISELGGGAENLSALTSGNPLGVTIMGLAELEAGNAADLMPFLRSLPWLPTDKIPPILATKDTNLKVRPWPFMLAFETDASLFDAFPVGHAELTVGFYAFEQTLLGISDDDAIGLHALVAVGPELDFKILKLGYRAGPSLDINNNGVFLAAHGSAFFGINLGMIGFTADMNGTFLVAMHGIDSSDYPQLSIVANASPSAGIPGLWSAGQVRDVRLLINEHGFSVVGIPSPLSEALSWLEDQIECAASETWENVTAGMDALSDATWDLLGEGANLMDAGIDTAADLMTDGLGTLYATGGALVDDVEDTLNTLSNAGSSAAGTLSDYAQNGMGLFQSGLSSFSSIF